MGRTVHSVIAVVVLTVGSTLPVARAQLAVLDPANLVQNIITALHEITQVTNQAVQLEHEVQSLANQAQNLQSMPSSMNGNVIGQYVTQFGSLIATIQGIDGIAHNLATLTAQYDATFPNTPLASGPLSYTNVMSQLSNWLGQTRNVYQGAYGTQAQIMTSLGADSSTIKALLTQSGASKGALDASETGNALTGQVASQLLKMNQQMAAMNQAQMNWIAQQTQMIAQAQKRQADAMVGYGAASTAPVNPNLDPMH